MPIVASLNGVTRGGWLGNARQIEEAGADALELNVYYIPSDLELTGVEVDNKQTTIDHNYNLNLRGKLGKKSTMGYNLLVLARRTRQAFPASVQKWQHIVWRADCRL